jgi:hypothetical protein
LLLVIAGLAAGLVAAGIGEATHGLFTPALTLQEIQGNKLLRPTPESTIAAIVKNGALANTGLGAALGLALGLAGGLAQRSGVAALKAALAGLSLGAVLGAVLSLGLTPLYYVARQFTATAEPDLSVAFFLHAGIWTPLGAAAGLAFALGLGGRNQLGRAVLGGLLGAFVGTLLYEIIGAVFFPLAGTAEPIAESWQPRVLARLLVPVLSALAIGRLVLAPLHSEKRAESPSPPQP